MSEKNPKAEKPDTALESLTPLMRQYHDIKARYPGMILFFRLGDFYEMFGDDAIKASPLLDVVLTRRQSVPMCGVPFHAVNAYIKRLIKAGEKVAVCEQLEDPGQSKGIVKRGVVRVITPGTILEDTLLDARENNYLLSIFPDVNDARFGIAYVDISTGEFRATELSREKLKHELCRLSPGEIVMPRARGALPFAKDIEARSGVTISPLDDWFFDPGESGERIRSQFRLQSLKPLGLEGRPLAAGACGGILAYVEQTQISSFPSLTPSRFYSLDDYLLLDEAAIRNLELLESLNTASRDASLIGSIDLTRTPMGARMLKQWILQPLLNIETVKARHAATGFFVDEGLCRRGIRDGLKKIADMERIVGRISSGSAQPRDLTGLRQSLELLPLLSEGLSLSGALVSAPAAITALRDNLRAPGEVVSLIQSAINDEPPVTLKEGGVIRAGHCAALDELRAISRDGRSVISRMEAGERARTGIANLKIGYTSVFGYYLEITKANLHLAPKEYIRKQTVAGGERFITPELKALEEKILSADEKIVRLEQECFREVLGKIIAHARELQSVSAALAELDIYCSFAEAAALYHYVRPEMDEGHGLFLRDGRHPVIERRLKSGTFVANDTFLNGDSDQIVLLTGPNMAGKSTYLRQVALIAILAQAGSFVPCAEAKIGIIDRIFTRIGAGDDLAGGESTFMVEMHETASILNQFTPRSLIILDEVGRGTSTYDGISIARASVEFLSRAGGEGKQGPKVLFATHYFELTGLAETYPGIKNYNVEVKDWQGEVVFMHRILPGAADRSYGIHVAQLAGLPKEVVHAAYGILAELEKKGKEPAVPGTTDQLELFNSNFSSPSLEIMIELEQLDVNKLTPLKALDILAQWKDKIPAPQKK